MSSQHPSSQKKSFLAFQVLLQVAAAGKYLPERWRAAYHRRKYAKRIQRAWTEELRPLPPLPTDARVNVMVVGTQKAGTSALMKLLGQHPLISLPVVKEPRFFNNFGYLQGETISVEAYHAAFPFRGPEMLYCEGTPETMFSPAGLRRVAQYNPQMKLICILRDPVERAYSAWNMNHHRGEYRSFEDLIEIEMKQIEQGGPVLQGFARYLSRGMYAFQIRELQRHFPKDQLKFIEYTYFKSHNTEVLNECATFLGLPTAPGQPQASKTNVYNYDSGIRPETEERLRAWFLPEIEEVEALLEWDLRHWKGLTPAS